MDCRTAQQEILERLAGEGAAELDLHITSCPACASLAAAQADVDRRLRRMLPPPELSARFRPALRRRIRSEGSRWLVDALPDVFHFVGWGAITIVIITLVPLDPGLLVATGATASLLSYVLFAAVRSSVET